MSRRLTKNELETAVRECLAAGNPYINDSIHFFVDREPRYLYHGEVYSEEQINKAYAQTCRNDVKSGYLDRLYGHYDKWYRYNRSDEGRAYDKGVKIATTKDGCEEDMRIIPV